MVNLIWVWAQLVGFLVFLLVSAQSFEQQVEGLPKNCVASSELKMSEGDFVEKNQVHVRATCNAEFCTGGW